MSNTQTGKPQTARQTARIFRPDERIRLLLVDDEPSILRSLRRLFRGAPYQVHTAAGGVEALEKLSQTPVDVIISDMRMPGMSGLEFLKNVESQHPQVKRIVLSGYAEPESVIGVVNEAQISSYVHKPWDDLDLKLKVKNAAEGLYLERLTRWLNLQLKKLNFSLEARVKQRTAQLAKARDSIQQAYQELDESYAGVVKMLSYYSSLSTPTMENHGENVAKIATRFANHIKLDKQAVQEIETAALLHDIGVAVISDEVLSKPWDSISLEEKRLIEKHPILGESTLMGLPAMHGVAKIIRHHHEWYNGQGYPDRLAGISIPLGSRIILLANDYENMTTGRGRKRPLSRNEALAHIEKHTPRHYDPELVPNFREMMQCETCESPHGDGPIRAVHSEELEPGMLLHKNLLNRDGMLLLTSRQRLTVSTIDSIRRLEQTDQQRFILYIRSEYPPTPKDQTVEVSIMQG